jgi:hypothetical protein
MDKTGVPRDQLGERGFRPVRRELPQKRVVVQFLPEPDKLFWWVMTNGQRTARLKLLIRA